jgi:hypothetical protein
LPPLIKESEVDPTAASYSELKSKSRAINSEIPLFPPILMGYC